MHGSVCVTCVLGGAGASNSFLHGLGCMAILQCSEYLSAYLEIVRCIHQANKWKDLRAQLEADELLGGTAKAKMTDVVNNAQDAASRTQLHRAPTEPSCRSRHILALANFKWSPDGEMCAIVHVHT